MLQTKKFNPRSYNAADILSSLPPPQTYFEDNPRDLQLLRHDLPLHPAVVKPHLGHVPDYLGECGEGWVGRWPEGLSGQKG